MLCKDAEIFPQHSTAEQDRC